MACRPGSSTSPAASLIEADRLVLIVMRERGYPMDDFEQRARTSRSTIRRSWSTTAPHTRSRSARTPAANTEDMRQGLVHYRALFEDLLGEDGEQLSEAR